jgi:hypothetical protein
MFLCYADINYVLHTVINITGTTKTLSFLVNSKCVTFLVLYSLFPDYLCKCSNSDVVALVMSMYIKLSNVLPEYDRYFLKHQV